MSRVHRFATAGILWAFAFLIHYLSVRLFQPGSILREQTAGGSIGSQTAAALQADVYTYLALWIPMFLVGFTFAWLLLTEYRDQRVANVTPGGRFGPR